MRLTAIKLAGFKSFVDPTTFPLEADRVAIVGPNGCGKSNVIDAVRWVLGESSARQLRGGAMADVIFNGTSRRPPVGQATIELVFSNESQRLTGPWGQYAELAVKRQITRAGQSQYSINQQKVRRRDVTDLFLGTGLGPRSYAIIEQGMISRIIEAKADELQTFLEEAAGVSKYKERRRETAQHMTQTRENLARLEDIRQELGRQLSRLQRQAKQAEKYQQLRQEERQLQAWLWGRRYRQADTRLAAAEGQNRRLEQQIAQQAAAFSRQQAALNAAQLAQDQARDALERQQQQWFSLQSAVQQQSQALSYRADTRRQRQQAVSQLTADLARLAADAAEDAAQLAALETALTADDAQLATLETALAAAETALQTAEGADQAGQAAWDQAQRALRDPQAAAAGEKARIEALEKQLFQRDRRRERLQLERDSLTLDADLARLADLDAECADLEAEQHQWQTDATRLAAELAALAAQLRTTESALTAAQGEWQQQQGQLRALNTLQAAALGEDDAPAGTVGHDDGAPTRLADHLAIPPAVVAAADGVLGAWATARVVSNAPQMARWVSRWQQGDLRLVDATALEHRDDWGIPANLAWGRRAIDDLNTALARRQELADGQFWVTPTGVCVGRDWLRWQRGGASGVIARQQAIAQLAADAQDTQAAIDGYQQQRNAAHTAMHTAQQAQQQGQAAANQRAKALQSLQHQRAQRAAQVTQNQRRHQALTAELADLDDEWREERENLALARLRLEEILEQLADAETAQAAWDQRRRDERAAVAAAKAQVAPCRTALQQAQLAATGRQRDADARRTAQERNGRLQAERQAQVDELHGLLAHEDEEVAMEQAQLEELLLAHEDATAARDAARGAVTAADEAVKQADGALRQTETQITALRESLAQWQGGLNEHQVLRQTALVQLDELGVPLTDALADLPEAADEEAQLGRVREQLQQLGAVNLAAIQEYAEVQERKGYLDRQHEDLSAALTALDTAIQQIDQETHSRFRDTFERVNAALGALFPRLFGGGMAKLSQVADGIAILAQPPGKRIGHIQQMSGGEKALTAVSLVFGIFQLNPAPFCLLDEVDAPLDEANVGRFGTLLREMSQRVQLIFITHNKATMETAQQLIGVTMQEPGVSRLVAVNVESWRRDVLSEGNSP